MAAFFSTGSLIGREVSNLQGQKLGLLEDFMIDTDRGEVQYAVLSFGGFLGMGNKLFAVPIQAMELDTEHEGFVLDIDKSRLEDAPGFSKDEWPDMADPAFQESLHGYYGTRTSSAPKRPS